MMHRLFRQNTETAGWTLVLHTVPSQTFIIGAYKQKYNKTTLQQQNKTKPTKNNNI